jgi:hypothetical protein
MTAGERPRSREVPETETETEVEVDAEAEAKVEAGRDPLQARGGGWSKGAVGLGTTAWATAK